MLQGGREGFPAVSSVDLSLVALVGCGKLVRIFHRKRRACAYVVASCLAISLASCATLQTPVAQVSYPASETLHAENSGIHLRVRPIVSQDEYLNLFDDFLPEIGIVALWVDVRNARSQAVKIQASDWHLETGKRLIHPMAVEDVLARYYQGRRVRMYTTAAHLTSRQNLEHIVFRAGTIEPSTEHAGFIFFAIDPGLARLWKKAAVLRLGDLRLSDGSNIAVQIDISYADA